MSAEVKCEVCTRTFKNKAGLKRHKCTAQVPVCDVATVCVTETPHGLTVPTREHPIVSGMYDNIESGWYESAGGGDNVAGIHMMDVGSGASEQPSAAFTPVKAEETAGMTQDEKLQWAINKIQTLSDEIIRLRQMYVGV